MALKKVTRTFELSIERHERVLIENGPTLRVQCIVCENEQRFITAALAARRMGVNQREIFRAVEGGNVGFTELAGGSLLICLGCVEPEIKIIN
jgi:hypothetical protein